MQTWVTLEIHAVFEKKAECFDMKLGLAVGKKDQQLVLTMVKWVTET